MNAIIRVCIGILIITFVVEVTLTIRVIQSTERLGQHVIELDRQTNDMKRKTDEMNQRQDCKHDEPK